MADRPLACPAVIRPSCHYGATGRPPL